MRHGVIVIAVLATIVTLNAQNGQGLPDVRRLYDAGKFKEVVGAVEESSDAADDAAPRLLYLSGLSHEKLNEADAARRNYRGHADGGRPAWAAIGLSALALMDKQLDDALASAKQATERNDTLSEAYYQRGIVQMTRREYGEAAGAFDRAIALDPSFAAAHYYGGLAEYRAKRIDRMATHFEAFLKLAPNAPERPEVESIMRTVRGR